MILPTASGDTVRLRLANEDPASEFIVESMTVGDEAVLFGGDTTGRIGPQSILCSDPISFSVEAGEKVPVTFFLPAQSTEPTIHWYGRERALISGPGNFTDSVPFPHERESDFRIVISGLDVETSSPSIGIVAIGDSITDGSSAPVGLDKRWPDITWRALRRAGLDTTMANAGIGGDRLLRDARHTGSSPGVLERLDRDAFGLAGQHAIVLAAGINDISWPAAKMRGRELAPIDQFPSLEEMIEGYEAFIQRARDEELIVFGATITPYRGEDDLFENFFNEDKEMLRQQVNAWIRTSGAFDAVIDFDEALRDPNDASSLSEDYDSGDHIHPNEAGFETMGALAALVIEETLKGRELGPPNKSNDLCARGS